MPALGDKLCFSIITGLIAGKRWHRIKQQSLCMMGSQTAHEKGKELVLPSFLFSDLRKVNKIFPPGRFVYHEVITAKRATVVMQFFFFFSRHLTSS